MDKSSSETSFFVMVCTIIYIKIFLVWWREKSTEVMPGGHLKITHKHGRPEFYHITERGSSRGRYISLAERELAAQLAQKDYDVKLMKVLQREIFALEKPV